MHALGYLAKRQDGPITSREIATRFEISEAHLAKVLQRLVKVGAWSPRRFYPYPFT